MNKRDILRSALAISRSRPSVNLSLEQYLMTPESMTQQIINLQNELCDKRVLCLGDDDHMSVLFAQFLNATPIVAEYDGRIRESLSVWHKKNDTTKAKIIEYDARAILPSKITADVFYINPPYSSKNQGKGAKVWISRVVKAVPVGSTSILVYPIDKDLPWTFECLKEIMDYAYGCGLAVINIDKDLHTYGHLPKDPGLLSSNIYLYKYANITPNEIADIDGESLYR